MLRIAVPNKGSLSETAAEMLVEAGYAGRRDPRALSASDPRNDVEFFYLRPRDIATYVGSGALDVGITGRDLLLDSGSEAAEIAALDFGGSTFRFAGRPGAYSDLADLEGVRVATSYPGLVGDFLARSGVTAKLVSLDGAVESAINLGVADAVADVVSTGSTLKAQGLEIFGPVILESTAVLISAKNDLPGIATLQRRLQGVLVARQYVLVDYDVSVSRNDYLAYENGDPLLGLKLAVGGVAGLVLLLGALGLVNIALVTVRQRIREIGIRRSFGATAGRVFFAVMMESVVASVAAGVIGVAVAVLIVQSPFVQEKLATGIIDVPPFPVEAALLGLGASAFVGTLAGLLPALVAVRVKVIDAIRY